MCWANQKRKSVGLTSDICSFRYERRVTLLLSGIILGSSPQGEIPVRLYSSNLTLFHSLARNSIISSSLESTSSLRTAIQ